MNYIPKAYFGLIRQCVRSTDSCRMSVVILFTVEASLVILDLDNEHSVFVYHNVIEFGRSSVITY